MSDDAEPAPGVREERRLSPMRRTIAERLGESYRNAVHVTLTRRVGAGALVAAAERATEASGVDVSIADVLLCAVAEALEAHPAFNATFEDGVHRLRETRDVAVAVSVEAGLLTPVIRDLGAMTVAEVAGERRRLTDLVRAGDHSMADIQGSSFTVSNLGPLGVDAFTPIINPPEVAILGVGRTRERARRGDDGVAFVPELTLSLSIDHRVVDGADGARFLETLAGTVEDAGDLVG